MARRHSHTVPKAPREMEGPSVYRARAKSGGPGLLEKTRRKTTHVFMPDDSPEIAFEMVGDDYNKTREQLVPVL